MALIHLFRCCDQRCVFCSYPAEALKKRETVGLKHWLKEISEMGPGLVQISGGEPLLAGAVTAASGCFNVNFPSHNSVSDLKITRTEGAFSARTRAVKEMLKLGAEVRLTHVVSKLNYAISAKFAAFAAGNFKNVSWLQFSFIKGIGRAEGPKLLPKYSEVVPHGSSKRLTCAARKGLNAKWTISRPVSSVTIGPGTWISSRCARAGPDRICRKRKK